MSVVVRAVGLLSLAVASISTNHGAVSLHPDNPRYFQFRGRVLAPITSTEHFGAVINLDFDYLSYLDTLAMANFTLTQAWTGSYVEPDSDVGPMNTLDPKPDKYIAPWVRSGVPGNHKGGDKFDLLRFNRTFFDRLRAFVGEAGKRGIVVEVGLFGGYEQTHEDIWQMSPFNPGNNVNGFDGVNITNVYSLGAPAAFRAAQLGTVRAIADALSEFDNHYFQVISVADHADVSWGERVADAVRSSDPGRLTAAPIGWRASARKGAFDVVNYGAAAMPGDVAAADPLRPAVMDETGAYEDAAAFRSSYWQWMLSGGTSVVNLDWSFCQSGFEDGTLPPAEQHSAAQGGPAARRTLSALATLLDSLDLVSMRADASWLEAVVISSASSPKVAGLARRSGGGGVAEGAAHVAGTGVVRLALRGWAERCARAVFIDTQHGTQVQVKGGREVEVPAYDGDFAIVLAGCSGQAAPALV